MPGKSCEPSPDNIHIKKIDTAHNFIYNMPKSSSARMPSLILKTSMPLSRKKTRNWSVAISNSEIELKEKVRFRPKVWRQN